MAKVQVRRIYEKPAPGDGTRVLVDQIWPRGLTRAKAALDEWCKEVAPSTELRKWYGHDPERSPANRRGFFVWVVAVGLGHPGHHQPDRRYLVPAAGDPPGRVATIAAATGAAAAIIGGRRQDAASAAAGLQ